MISFCVIVGAALAGVVYVLFFWEPSFEEEDRLRREQGQELARRMVWEYWNSPAGRAEARRQAGEGESK